jgi:hypothetical protein
MAGPEEENTQAKNTVTPETELATNAMPTDDDLKASVKHVAAASATLAHQKIAVLAQLKVDVEAVLGVLTARVPYEVLSAGKSNDKFKVLFTFADSAKNAGDALLSPDVRDSLVQELNEPFSKNMFSAAGGAAKTQISIKTVDVNALAEAQVKAIDVALNNSLGKFTAVEKESKKAEVVSMPVSATENATKSPASVDLLTSSLTEGLASDSNLSPEVKELLAAKTALAKSQTTTEGVKTSILEADRRGNSNRLLSDVLKEQEGQYKGLTKSLSAIEDRIADKVIAEKRKLLIERGDVTDEPLDKLEVKLVKADGSAFHAERQQLEGELLEIRNDVVLRSKMDLQDFALARVTEGLPGTKTAGGGVVSANGGKALSTRMFLQSPLLDDFYGNGRRVDSAVEKHIVDSVSKQIESAVIADKHRIPAFKNFDVALDMSGESQHGGPSVVVTIKSEPGHYTKYGLNEADEIKALAADRIAIVDSIEKKAIGQKVTFDSVEQQAGGQKIGGALQRAFQHAWDYANLEEGNYHVSKDRKNLIREADLSLPEKKKSIDEGAVPIKISTVEFEKLGLGTIINKAVHDMVAARSEEINVNLAAISSRRRDYAAVLGGNVELDKADSPDNTSAEKANTIIEMIEKQRDMKESDESGRYTTLVKELPEMLKSYAAEKAVMLSAVPKDDVDVASQNVAIQKQYDKQWSRMAVVAETVHSEAKTKLKTFETKLEVMDYQDLMGEQRKNANALVRDVELASTIRQTVRIALDKAYGKEFEVLNKNIEAQQSGENSQYLTESIAKHILPALSKKIEESDLFNRKNEPDVVNEEKKALFMEEFNDDTRLARRFVELAATAKSGEVQVLWGAKSQIARDAKILNPIEFKIKALVSSRDPEKMVSVHTDDVATTLRLGLVKELDPSSGELPLPGASGLAATAIQMAYEINKKVQNTRAYENFRDSEVIVRAVDAGKGTPSSRDEGETNKSPYLEVVITGRSDITSALAQNLTVIAGFAAPKTAMKDALKENNRFADFEPLNGVTLQDKLVKFPHDEKVSSRYMLFKLDGTDTVRADKQAKTIELHFARQIGLIDPGTVASEKVGAPGRTDYQRSSYKVERDEKGVYVAVPAGMSKGGFEHLLGSRGGLKGIGLEIDDEKISTLVKSATHESAKHDLKVPTAPLNFQEIKLGSGDKSEGSLTRSMMTDKLGNNIPSVRLEIPIVGTKARTLAELAPTIQATQIMLAGPNAADLSTDELMQMRVSVMQHNKPGDPSNKRDFKNRDMLLIDIPTVGDEQKTKDRMINLTAMVNDHKNHTIGADEVVKEVEARHSNMVRVVENGKNAGLAAVGLLPRVGQVGAATALSLAIASVVAPPAALVGIPVVLGIAVGTALAAAGATVMGFAASKNIDRFDDKKVLNSERTKIGLIQREQLSGTWGKISDFGTSFRQTIREANKSTSLAAKEFDVSKPEAKITGGLLLATGVAGVVAGSVFTAGIGLVPLVAVALSKMLLSKSGDKAKDEVDRIQDGRKAFGDDSLHAKAIAKTKTKSSGFVENALKQSGKFATNNHRPNSGVGSGRYD